MKQAMLHRRCSC